MSLSLAAFVAVPLGDIVIDGLQGGGTTTGDDTPTILGHVTYPGGSVSGLSITIKLNGVANGTATTDGTGHFAYMFATLANADYTAEADVTLNGPLSGSFSMTINAGPQVDDAITAAFLLMAA